MGWRLSWAQGKCRQTTQWAIKARQSLCAGDLVQAAHGVRRTKTYLGERYRRLKKRRGQ